MRCVGKASKSLKSEKIGGWRHEKYGSYGKREKGWKVIGSIMAEAAQNQCGK